MVLVHNHTILRQGLRAILQAEIDLELVGEATDVPVALMMVRRLQPDVLITDVSFGNGNGMKAAGDLQRECCAMRIVLLGNMNDWQRTNGTMETSVHAYLTRRSSVEELLRAIMIS